MATRLIQTCGDCAPCEQGCCCAEIAFGGFATYGECLDTPVSCKPVQCRWIFAINLTWNTPGDCLQARIDEHGGLKEFRLYIGECGEVPDRVLAAGATSVQIDREELFGCTAAESCSNIMDDFRFCLEVVADDDTVLTRCLACVNAQDEPMECGGSSSSSQSSDGSGSSSSQSSQSSASSSSSSGSGDGSSSSGSGDAPSSSSSSSGSSSDNPPEPPGSSGSSGSSQGSA